jgi:anti-anti-sigma factor
VSSSLCMYSPAGRIDASNASSAEADLLAMLEKDGPSVIINLAQLSYLSSAGLRVMLVGAKRSKAAGGKAVILGAQPAVAEVLKMSGFDRIIPLVSSEDEARALLGS